MHYLVHLIQSVLDLQQLVYFFGVLVCFDELVEFGDGQGDVGGEGVEVHGVLDFVELLEHVGDDHEGDALGVLVVGDDDGSEVVFVDGDVGEGLCILEVDGGSVACFGAAWGYGKMVECTRCRFWLRS